MQKKRFARIEKSFPLSSGGFLGDAVDFIHDSLLSLGTVNKLVLKTELLAEEIIVQLMQHAPENAVLRVRVRRFPGGDAKVLLSMPGEEFDPFSEGSPDIGLMEEGTSDTEDVIRSILLRSYGEDFKYRHKNRVNHVRILAGQAERSMLTSTLTALALGLLFGMLSKLVFPEMLTDSLCTYLLSPVKTMFMNGLKIVIAPVVFFSIVTCFSQFNSLAELGRLGAKVMGMYLLTTVIAVSLGIGITVLIQPGEWGFALSGAAESAAVSLDSAAEPSVLQMIVNIVPSNFLQPFVESETLQLIFLAVLCGIAVGMIGEYSRMLKELFDAFYSLFLTITSVIIRFMPAAVFCSVALLVIELGGSSLLSVLSAAFTMIFAIFCMLCIYGLFVLAFARLNPLIFFRKAREGMLTSFTLSSSSAAMPANMRVCTEKLGISPKICNFSIPLGATINMDGTCISLCVMGIFLARAYGVAISPSAMLSISLTIILLSLGAPGVPGANLICLGVVLSALNVPQEAIGLVIAINPLLSMFNTMSNTTGDVMTALVVARSENLVDLETYHSPG